ncbi:MAG: Crp/Fnr family transcriptional regulator [Bacteroidales bacterium]
MSASLGYYDLLILRIKDYIFLNKKEVELVKNLFKEEHFKKNEVILREGDVCRKLYFVADGIVRFSQISNGEERTFVFRPEGAFCNDLESFLKKTPSQNSISAIGPTTVLSITYDNLQVFYNQTTFGDRFGRLAIEHIFVMVVHHLTTFYSENPEQRYVRFANNHGDLLQRIPQYYIASYVGVTPQALCRIKKKLLGRNL